MAISPTSPLTGATVTGLTSPTYTLASDTAPSNNGKQYAVTALGGTQTGVEAHSVSKPFTLTFFRPASFRALGSKNSNGVLTATPKNSYKVITRKGVEVHSDGDVQPLIVTTEIAVPAGSDVIDPESVRAALSCHIGALSNQSDEISDLVVSGVL